MPEVFDHSMGVKILLPRGKEMVRGQVLVPSCNLGMNMMGRTHINPIIDTKMNQVEFVEGEVPELTTNIIAGSMYT